MWFLRQTFQWWLGRWLSSQEHLLLVQRIQVEFPQHTVASTICDFSSKGSNGFAAVADGREASLFWPMAPPTPTVLWLKKFWIQTRKDFLGSPHGPPVVAPTSTSKEDATPLDPSQSAFIAGHLIDDTGTPRNKGTCLIYKTDCGCKFVHWGLVEYEITYLA